MKKILLIASFLAIPFLGNSQIFQENFDGNGPGFAAWTLIDVDGLIHDPAVTDFDAGAWIRKNRGGPIPNYGGPDNDFAAMSSSWYAPPGTSNDWLISPQITLPAGNAFLQWDSKAQDLTFKDGYKVMLSPNGGNTVADFTVQLFTIPAENSAWTTRTVNLDAYKGTTVRIAFVNNSTDMFVLLVDNISVNLQPTAPPNCPTLVAPANGATGINYYVPVPLSWAASTGASSYDVYLGTSPNPTTLLGNVSGTSTTATVLAGTTYYWRVLAKNTAGASVGCTDFSFQTNQAPTSPPNCPALVAPANGTASVDYTVPVPLSWTASAGATSYDVYLGTNANPTTLLGNVVGTSTTAPGLLPLTTYYWKVLGKNEAGASVGCTVYSFTTAANPFAPYCGPLVFTYKEPITLVNFAGINNVSSPATAGGIGHENFINIVGNVNQGGSYPITLKGNTDGPYTNRFAVFIDWNQNGILDDNGESYLITQTIVNSTGVDAVQAVQTLAVPAGATLGNTRMRVKKIFGTTDYANPCLGGSFGQAEDYTINVGAALAVNDMTKNAIRVYPNPVVDVLNIEAPSNVKSISVFDLSGKAVSTQVLNAAKSQVNLSKLAPGVYMVNVVMDNETKTVKIIKK